MFGGTMSGTGYARFGTVTGQSLYGANVGGAPSPSAATAPKHAVAGGVSGQLFGVQLPVLIAIGVATWWLWREYE